jgi:hypothetical protein
VLLDLDVAEPVSRRVPPALVPRTRVPSCPRRSASRRDVARRRGVSSSAASAVASRPTRAKVPSTRQLVQVLEQLFQPSETLTIRPGRVLFCHGRVSILSPKRLVQGLQTLCQTQARRPVARPKSTKQSRLNLSPWEFTAYLPALDAHSRSGVLLPRVRISRQISVRTKAAHLVLDSGLPMEGY